MLQFPTLLNGHIPVPLPSVDAPSPLLLSSSSHKSWCHPELQERRGPNQVQLCQISTDKDQTSQPWTLMMNDIGAWLPLSPVILLVWNLFLCIYCLKKQELHFGALLSEKSICFRHFFVFTSVHLLCSCSFTFVCGVFNFLECKSLWKKWRPLFSSRFTWFKLQWYRLTAISWMLFLCSPLPWLHLNIHTIKSNNKRSGEVLVRN